MNLKQANHDRYTRPSLERMMLIHEHIQSGRYPNCTWLAVELEVSIRTIKRDVEFLVERKNLPIKYDRLKRGYYYTRPVDQFPSVAITEKEVFALLVAHKVITTYHGTPFEEPLRMAFTKLNRLLNSKTRYTLISMAEMLSFRPLAPEDADLKVFMNLAEALRQRRVLKFQYRKLGAKTWQGREVQPHHLACIDNHWYLFAHDLNRGEIRTFALSRLRQLELTEQQFDGPGRFNADEYLKGSLSVFKGNQDYEVVIDFDEWATDLLRGRRWHRSQEITELPSGRSSMRLLLNNLEEVESWVLSCGIHATVVRPKALAERVRKTAAALAERYREQEGG